jgi:YD repeat-containing protein
MPHKKKSRVALFVAFCFLFSLVAGVGVFTPAPSFAYHDPEHGDQGHTGSTQKPPKNTKPPSEVNRFSCSPIHLRTGNFFYSHRDLFIPGCGFSLKVDRNYDSHDFYDGPFGHGWKFNSDVKLTETTDESGEYATIRKSNGVRVVFSKNADGSYSAPPGRHDTLRKNADDTFTWYESGCSTCGGTCYLFNVSGCLTKILDPNNNQISFSYDGTGKLTKVTDTSGRQLTITYGSNNKISTITGPANRTFTYGYDLEGNLISYADPFGNTTTYAYDTNHKLTSITDPNGNAIIALTYDDHDRVITYSSYQGTWTYSYDPENNTTCKDDPEGRRWTITYSDTGQLLTVKDPYNNTTTYDWDDNINLISVKDARGFTTAFTYDDNGNMLTKTDALGNVTTYTYDTNHNKISTITDPLGNISKLEYDSNGDIIKVIRDYGGALEHQTTFTYESRGHLASFTDPLSNTTTFTWESGSVNRRHG